MSQATETLAPAVLTKNELLKHWQGDRGLTRKVIQPMRVFR